MIAEEVRGLGVRRQGGATEPAALAVPDEPATVGTTRARPAAMRLLRSLRAVAPGSKDWG